MKPLDRFLRAWRTRIALRAAPPSSRAVLDIGCGDDYLLRRVSATRRIGIDPALPGVHIKDGISLFPGRFPHALDAGLLAEPYDAVFALAVFEHFTDDELVLARDRLPDLLGTHGRLVATVPHPVVDAILDLLIRLRLIDGQSVHEHHGFQPEQMMALCSNKLRLVHRKRFQLGLNNLFVFERT